MSEHSLTTGAIFSESLWNRAGWNAAPVRRRNRQPTGWFVVNWLFCWPLAIYSLVSHWNKIDPAAYTGNMPAAQFHAAKVKTLGIIGLCVGLGLGVLSIVLNVVVLASVSTGN